MLTIDRAWQMLVPATDEIVLRYRRLLPDGTASDMQGEVWAFAIGARGADPVVAIGTRGADLDGAYFELRHDAGTGPALAGQLGLRWSLAEVLPGGLLDTRYEGPVTVRAGLAIDVTPPAIGDGETLMIVDEETDG